MVRVLKGESLQQKGEFKVSYKPTFDMKKILRRINTMQRRIIILIGATANERHEHFVNTYPDILQRVPQKMIASYLRVAHEALSKVRARKKISDFDFLIYVNSKDPLERYIYRFAI